MSEHVSPLGREIAAHVLDHMTPEELVRMAIQKTLASAATSEDGVAHLTALKGAYCSMASTHLYERMIRECALMSVSVRDMKPYTVYHMMTDIDGIDHVFTFVSKIATIVQFKDVGSRRYYITYKPTTEDDGVFVYQTDDAGDTVIASSQWLPFPNGYTIHETPPWLLNSPFR